MGDDGDDSLEFDALYLDTNVLRAGNWQARRFQLVPDDRMSYKLGS